VLSLVGGKEKLAADFYCVLAHSPKEPKEQPREEKVKRQPYSKGEIHRRRGEKGALSPPLGLAGIKKGAPLVWGRAKRHRIEQKPAVGGSEKLSLLEH